jgi:dienelactone hydrolase
MKYCGMIFLILLAASSVHAAGRAVVYELDGKSYEGYYTIPSAGAPLVLLIHDRDGLTGYEIRRAEMLAEEGYAVFAADLFGAGIRPADVHESMDCIGELYKNRDKMRFLIRGAFEAAQAQGADIENSVAAGYCFGGSAVLEFARSGAPLKGFVSFHGGLKTPEGQDYTKAQGKVLVLHGTADASIAMDEFAGLANELEAQGIAHEMITYGGAPHAFTIFDSDNYREEADRKSWKRFTAFLAETLNRDNGDR